MASHAQPHGKWKFYCRRSGRKKKKKKELESKDKKEVRRNKKKEDDGLPAPKRVPTRSQFTMSP